MTFHSDEDYARYVRDLKRSVKAVAAVAGVIALRGFDLHIPGLKIAGRYDDLRDFVDKGDIQVVGSGWIDVKWFKTDFSCAEDWPHPEYFVGQVRPYDEWPYLYINCNRDLTHAGVVHKSSKEHWHQRDVDNRYEGKVRPTWICPLEHVRWMKLDPYDDQ